MNFLQKKQFIETLANRIDFLRKEYQLCKEKSFAFWDPNDPRKRVPHWKTTILWWKKKPFKPVHSLVPKTVELLKDGPGHRATGWMELAPHTSVPTHNHKDWHNSLILHIPIIIPQGDLGFCVEGKSVYRWKENELYVFDANLEHWAYNNTNEHRVILGLDFDNSWRNVLECYMH